MDSCSNLVSLFIWMGAFFCVYNWITKYIVGPLIVNPSIVTSTEEIMFSLLFVGLFVQDYAETSGEEDADTGFFSLSLY